MQLLLEFLGCELMLAALFVFEIHVSKMTPQSPILRNYEDIGYEILAEKPIF